MTKRLICTMLVALLVIGGPGQAIAEQTSDPEVTASPGLGGINYAGGGAGGGSTAGSGGGPGGSACAPPGYRCVAAPIVRFGVGPLGYCLGSTVDIIPIGAADPFLGNWALLGALYPLCPGTTPPVKTPAMWALEFWGQVALPVPAPEVAPGRAITGRGAFLETGIDPRPTFTRPTPYGTLTIAATGTVHATWGDGAQTTGAPGDAGGPWPDGTISHVYTERGLVTLTARTTWTATWSLAGQSGALSGLATTGTLPNFPVQEIQAVITG